MTIQLSLRISREEILERWDVDIESGNIYHKEGRRKGQSAVSISWTKFHRVGHWWPAHYLIWVAAGNPWPDDDQIVTWKWDRGNNAIANLGVVSKSSWAYAVKHCTDGWGDELQGARFKCAYNRDLEGHKTELCKARQQSGAKVEQEVQPKWNEKEFRIRERMRQRDEYMARLKEKHGKS